MDDLALRQCMGLLLLADELLRQDPADGLISAHLSHVIEALAARYRVVDSHFILVHDDDSSGKPRPPAH